MEERLGLAFMYFLGLFFDVGISVWHCVRRWLAVKLKMCMYNGKVSFCKATIE